MEFKQESLKKGQRVSTKNFRRELRRLQSVDALVVKSLSGEPLTIAEQMRTVETGGWLRLVLRSDVISYIKNDLLALSRLLLPRHRGGLETPTAVLRVCIQKRQRNIKEIRYRDFDTRQNFWLGWYRVQLCRLARLASRPKISREDMVPEIKCVLEKLLRMIGKEYGKTPHRGYGDPYDKFLEELAILQIKKKVSQPIDRFSCDHHADVLQSLFPGSRKAILAFASNADAGNLRDATDWLDNEHENLSDVETVNFIWDSVRFLEARPNWMARVHRILASSQSHTRFPADHKDKLRKLLSAYQPY